MLVELFYPKELKDVVEKLRVENDLNERALETLNAGIYLYFILWAVVSGLLFLFFNFQSAAVSSFLCGGFAILACGISTRYTYKTCMTPYIYGVPCRAVVVKLYTRGRNIRRPITDIRVRLLPAETREIVIKGVYMYRNHGSVIKKNDEIEIFYTQGKRCDAVLNNEDFKSDYCLMKSKMKD